MLSLINMLYNCIGYPWQGKSSLLSTLYTRNMERLHYSMIGASIIGTLLPIFYYNSECADHDSYILIRWMSRSWFISFITGVKKQIVTPIFYYRGEEADRDSVRRACMRLDLRRVVTTNALIRKPLTRARHTMPTQINGSLHCNKLPPNGCATIV